MNPIDDILNGCLPVLYASPHYPLSAYAYLRWSVNNAQRGEGSPAPGQSFVVPLFRHHALIQPGVSFHPFVLVGQNQARTGGRRAGDPKYLEQRLMKGKSRLRSMFHSFNTRFFVCSLCGRASLKKSEWNVVAIFALKWSWLITLGNSVFNQRDIDIAEPACNNVCSCSRTFSRYTT